MRRVRTISVSLEPPYVEALDRLAKSAGSKSEALRRLLEEHERREKLAEMEEAYRDYYSNPENVKASRELTEEMLSIARWPEEWYIQPRHARGKKGTGWASTAGSPRGFSRSRPCPSTCSSGGSKRASPSSRRCRS